MESVGNRLGLGWIEVKRAGSWRWGWLTERLYRLGADQEGKYREELDWEPTLASGKKRLANLPLGWDPVLALPAPGSGGCVRGNHSRHLVLIPCHTLTPLLNSLLLLRSPRVSLPSPLLNLALPWLWTFDSHPQGIRPLQFHLCKGC